MGLHFVSMTPSLMFVSVFSRTGIVALPDCLTILECEGAVASSSTVHCGLPVPVLVAVQPFGGPPTASASKLTVPCAMAPTSAKQHITAAMTAVRVTDIISAAPDGRDGRLAN